MFPNEKIAIGLLSNGASTNIGVEANIKNILDDNLSQTYTMSGTQLLDAGLSSATRILLAASIR